ncbi:MAG: UPF0149 family protein [Smithellaceae bacterium]
MFKVKEEKNLAYVLSKSSDQETMLFMEELHGLIFGLAMTPEVISPAEWLPLVFNEEPRFDDDQDAQICIGHLIDAYNRMVTDSNKGKLAFPFNFRKLSEYEYSLIEGWCYGLFLALSLRPHIWGMSDEYSELDEEDIPEDIHDLIDACGIITAIAMPDEREEMIEAATGAEAESAEELEEMLYSMLPLCVKNLQEHCAKVRRISEEMTQSGAPAAIYKAIPGHDDPCPCGSGKKYKKCCGNN